jgi:hypothetical protein
MTFHEVAQMVESIGLPYAYYEFPDGTGIAPPFICFYFPESDDFAADNTNYQRIRPCHLELYTDNKDFALEQRVEDALNAAGFVYSRSEGYLDGERMNMVSYDFTVFITD